MKGRRMSGVSRHRNTGRLMTHDSHKPYLVDLIGVPLAPNANRVVFARYCHCPLDYENSDRTSIEKKFLRDVGVRCGYQANFFAP